MRPTGSIATLARGQPDFAKRADGRGLLWLLALCRRAPAVAGQALSVLVELLRRNQHLVKGLLAEEPASAKKQKQ